VCHCLSLLRSKLTFDQLVGANIQYGNDETIVRTRTDFGSSSALCSNHVMRSGRHFAGFVGTGSGGFAAGVMRPVQIDRSDFSAVRELAIFSPVMEKFREYLRNKSTERWTDSNVHCCRVDTAGCFNWYDWTSTGYQLTSTGYQQNSIIDGFLNGGPFELLLDLDEGTLSLYHDGERIAMLKDGLSGEYCWFATVYTDLMGWGDASVTIERK